ncbi:hypothetical protein [Rhodanobacter sp. B04]|nr:hypothetical protein [Rhodanobacter sp. B04]
MFIFRYPGWRLVLFAEVTVSAIEAIKAARSSPRMMHSNIFRHQVAGT